jgi:HEAT repeat protein
MRKIFAVVAVWAVLAAGTVAVAAESGGLDLLGAVKSGDEKARCQAIDVLGARGTQIEGAVPALIEQLSDESPLIRAHAADALGRIGPAAKAAAEPLAEIVFQDDPMVRREAIQAYRDINPGPRVSIPLFARLFREADPATRIHVMDALAERGRIVVPAMVRALQSEQLTYWACLVLHEIGPDAAGAVPALCEVARKDDRPEVRREAVLALAAIGPKAAAAVPVLSALLDEKDVPGLTGAVVFSLGSIGRAAKPAEPKVKALAEEPGVPAFLRTVCHWARARMNPEDEQLVRQVVPELVAALASDEPRLRAAAARALLTLNPDPAILRPEMKKVFDTAKPEVVHAVLDALATLGSDAVPRLTEALKVPEARLRAAGVLRRLGPDAKDAVPGLVDALADENAEVRSEVLFALGAIGTDAADAVPAIVKALDDEEMKVVYTAAYALGQIGPKAMEAKPALVEKLEVEDEFLTMAVAWALARIHPECKETAPKAVPVLIKALAEPDAMTRIHACESLSCLGPLAKQAVPALKELANAEDPEVRKAAAEAIEAIEK